MEELPMRDPEVHNLEPQEETEGRTILGVTISDMGTERAIDRIDRAITGRGMLNVCFANAHTLNLAAGNNRFRATLRDFLVLNDGLGVDIASRLKFGKTFRENLNGTYMVGNLVFLSRALADAYR